jgi:hypothetical protein
MRPLLVLVTAAVALLGLVACSSDEGGRGAGSSTTVKQGSELRAGDLGAAVAAVEAALGGPQQYAEINATTEGVNVFVASSATEEVAYFYRSDDAALDPPAGPDPLQSTPFALDGVDVGIAPSLVQQLQEQFPGSEVVQLALVDIEEQGLVWALRSRSARGGLLNVFFSPSGALLAVDPAS